MENKLTIVMYHFVRDLEHSRYPEIKGLRLHEFREQIAYIERHYNFVRMEDVVAAVISGGREDLPPNAILLTFDDGYADHFANVFPILNLRGIQGVFFPPAKAVIENEVLDVNKIHFTLASVPDKSSIINNIFSMLHDLRQDFPIYDDEYYASKVATDSRFDTKEVTFIKRMLQKELPEGARKKIIDELFRLYVTSDEKAFSRELYMSADQLACMKQNGMFIGSHGYDHYWLGTLDTESQKREVDLSLEFLKEIGAETENWVMCYPYGSYDESLLSILKEKGCKVGLTVDVEVADLLNMDPLTLPRLDTNDLPKEKNAEPNTWTLRAVGEDNI